MIKENVMDLPPFSVVIPVYNGLSHGLSKCLDSIWAQPIDQSLYEVICVDDCSTDNTRDWLQAQSLEHGNLKIIWHSVNKRQGGGRNTGIKSAKGRYIMFIDQDDYYHQGAFKKVYDHLRENDLDILIVDCAYQYPGFESNKLQHNYSDLDIRTGDEFIQRNGIPWAPWKFIFRKSLVIEQHLFFDEKERIEDIDWVHKLTHSAKRVQYQPILFIHYIKSDISTTMTSYKSIETVYSTIRCAKRIRDMVGTTFEETNEVLQSKIFRLSESVYNTGLRNYLLCKDSSETKARNIKKEIVVPENMKFEKPLVLFAIKWPLLFATLSNLCSPITELVLIVYRKVKYRIR